MGSTIQPNSVALLNSPNLRTLDSTAPDKSRSLHSYVRSQQAFLSTYLAEGRATSSSWNTNLPVPTHERANHDANGFDTPLLKPRRPEARLLSLENIPPTPSVRLERTKEVAEVDITAPTPVNRPSKGKGRAKVDAEERNIEQPAPLTSEAPAPTRKTKRRREGLNEKKCQDPMPSKHSKQRKITEYVDDEHRERLAQRRERRRAKKAIVDPKPRPPESESEEEREGQGAKKKGKKKTVKIPAGLALMHGFSAPNVGKNRLTLNLEPSIGVFNKGKASAKTSTKRKNTSKALSKMFSEDWFLNKSKQPDSDDESRGEADSSSMSEAIILKPEPNLHRCKTVKPMPSKSVGKPRKRTRVASPPLAAEEDQSSCSDTSLSSPSKTERRREDSPVWDIEVEGRPLPSEIASSLPPPRVESALGGTVVLDTHSKGWALLAVARRSESPRNLGGQPTIEKGSMVEATRVDDLWQPAASTVSSLCPSQSASQALGHPSRIAKIDTPSFPTVSKYFNPPVARSESSVQNSTPAARRTVAGKAPNEPALDDAPLPDNTGATPSLDITGAIRPTSRISRLEDARYVGPLHAGHEADDPLDDAQSLGVQTSDAGLFYHSPNEDANPQPFSDDTNLGVPHRGDSERLDCEPAFDDLGELDHVPYSTPGYMIRPDLRFASIPPHLPYDTSDLPSEILAPGVAFPDLPYPTETYDPLDNAPPAESVYAEHLPDPYVLSAYVEPHAEGHSWDMDGSDDEPTMGYPVYDSVGAPSYPSCQYAAASEPQDVSSCIDDCLINAEVDQFYPPDVDLYEEPGPDQNADVGDVDGSDAVSDTEQSVSVVATTVAALQRFSQGRALLLGIEEQDETWEGPSVAEQDVVRSLRDHWLPQRF